MRQQSPCHFVRHFSLVLCIDISHLLISIATYKNINEGLHRTIESYDAMRLMFLLRQVNLEINTGVSF